jgi:capsule polysaccharide export protein KpsE/RkpR
MVKRLKKNPKDLEQQPMAEVEAGLVSEGEWDAQQQATVAAYAHSRGMRPQEVLQALINSMEKTLRKEKGENLAGQTSSLDVSQR